ncbi:hypothetical protein ACJJTC_007888 [Scirpophaga incertulas]
MNANWVKRWTHHTISSKNNFFLTNYFSTIFHFETTWSFFECGHGKGVADAIGGVTKRLLDRRVSYREDIISATDVYSTLQTFLKTVHIAYITETEIETIKKYIPNDLGTINGTMKIHQLLYVPGSDRIKHRILSCFCSESKTSCSCFDPIEYTFKNIANIIPVTGHDDPCEIANTGNFKRKDTDVFRLQEAREEGIYDEMLSFRQPILDSTNIGINHNYNCLSNNFDITNLPIMFKDDDLPQEIIHKGNANDLPIIIEDDALPRKSNERKGKEENVCSKNIILEKENKKKYNNLTLNLIKPYPKGHKKIYIQTQPLKTKIERRKNR